MKRLVIFLLTLLLAFSFASCKNSETFPAPSDSTSIGEVSQTSDDSSSDKKSPETNAELFDYIITKWKTGNTSELYEYASPEVKTLMTQATFVEMFKSISRIGGDMISVNVPNVTSSDDVDTYTSIVDFENIQTEVSISLQHIKISGFVHNVRFKHSFEIAHKNNITEKYFVLETEGFKLNAVYTYIDDGTSHPAALLISGSGPCDYNETVGMLKPFEDIALGLAENGVNSLRIDKRTLNYADAFVATHGIDEEYLDDYGVALDFLKKQDVTNLYLLGHSLGGQIAAEIAKDDRDIDGMILFNSSARHLADIICDQYTALDPTNQQVYEAYADTARNFSEQTANDGYYFGTTGWYWSSYNRLQTIDSIKNAGIPTLIINSTYDKQSFKADIDLWEQNFDNAPFVTLECYNDISHFGYKIDPADTSALYSVSEFPQELITDFAGFCK